MKELGIASLFKYIMILLILVFLLNLFSGKKLSTHELATMFVYDGNYNYVPVCSDKLYYKVFGKNGSNIIMLHGFSVNGDSFSSLCSLLSKNHVVYVLDMPGYYRSTCNESNYSIEGLAKQISIFIDYLYLKDCTVIGSSMGGAVALSVAKANTNVKDLVLISPVGFNVSKSNYNLYKTLHAVLPRNIFNSIFMSNIYSRVNIFSINNSTVNNITALYDKLNICSDYRDRLNVLYQLSLSSSVFDATSISRFINLPILFIWGSSDEVINIKYSAKATSLFPNSSLVILDNMGHLPHVDYPEIVATHIDSFIQ